ncbi:MAG: hypothetical protein RSE54_10355, partial [Ruthenibacterium sp.]
MVIDATHLYAPRDISYFPQITIIPVKRATALDHTMRGGSMFATNKIIKSPAFYNDFLPK